MRFETVAKSSLKHGDSHWTASEHFEFYVIVTLIAWAASILLNLFLTG